MPLYTVVKDNVDTPGMHSNEASKLANEKLTSLVWMHKMDLSWSISLWLSNICATIFQEHFFFFQPTPNQKLQLLTAWLREEVKQQEVRFYALLALVPLVEYRLSGRVIWKQFWSTIIKYKFSKSEQFNWGGTEKGDTSRENFKKNNKRILVNRRDKRNICKTKT